MREKEAEAGTVIWIQRFLVPATSVRIADLRSLNDGNYLNDVFFFTEIASEAPGAHATMLFTQVVAALIGNSGFEGLRAGSQR